MSRRDIQLSRNRRHSESRGLLYILDDAFRSATIQGVIRTRNLRSPPIVQLLDNLEVAIDTTGTAVPAGLLRRASAPRSDWRRANLLTTHPCLTPILLYATNTQHSLVYVLQCRRFRHKQSSLIYTNTRYSRDPDLLQTAITSRRIRIPTTAVPRSAGSSATRFPLHPEPVSIHPQPDAESPKPLTERRLPRTTHRRIVRRAAQRSAPSAHSSKNGKKALTSWR